MRIRLWGVRGSLPSPQLPSQIKSKISAIIERITPGDLESAETRERFLAGLPSWLFGTVGGNTSCVSVQVKDGAQTAETETSQPDELLIFDAGSGLRELGASMQALKLKPEYHLFFSHFHWDHINGFPFFGPAYDPSVKLNIYSPFDNIETILRDQMIAPYFPVKLQSMASQKTFTTLSAPITVDGARVSFRAMNHPGGCYSFKVDDGKHTFIYATDTELSADDFLKTSENTAFFSGADLLVIDSQYTLGEAIEKYNWGHSAFSMAVDFAANWKIKHIVLFHHDPAYDDHKLFNNVQSAKWYTERLDLKGMKLSLAIEGTEIVL